MPSFGDFLWNQGSKIRSFHNLSRVVIPLSGGASGDPSGCYRGSALAETLKDHFFRGKVLLRFLDIFDILVRFFDILVRFLG